jgi:hypothetical protein
MMTGERMGSCFKITKITSNVDFLFPYFPCGDLFLANFLIRSVNGSTLAAKYKDWMHTEARVLL